MTTASVDLSQADRLGRLVTGLGDDALLLTDMMGEEALSRPFSLSLECFSPVAQPVHDLLGTQASVEIGGTSGFQHRWYSGVVWEYPELGQGGDGYRYRLLIRPTAMLMTLNRRNRIFQNQSVVDIVRSVITAPLDVKLMGTYDPLEYCVQSQESDWDFVNRLLGYEGIYFFFTHADGADTMVLVDDYDFEAPTAQMTQAKTAPKPVGDPSPASAGGGQGSAGSWSAEAEIYDFPAKYASKASSLGERRSAAWLEAHRGGMART